VGCNSQLKVGGNNLPPKAAGGNNLPPQFWRQQSATKNQQPATREVAATICHQKADGNNLPPKSWRQQSATKKLAAAIDQLATTSITLMC
jgi:hypothetical protein